MESKLIFLISAPRSGSTLLARILGAHSKIHAPAELHLISPLEHLGYYANVDKASYDPIIVHQATREMIQQLPAGEEDYLQALRNYTNHIYHKICQASQKEFLLDKTPANALSLDFLKKLYPDAHYVVLTRHPLAIWASYVDSFFVGDAEVAHTHNPLLERYVPAISRFLAIPAKATIHLAYENLVSNPEPEIRRLCEFLELPFESSIIQYGQQKNTEPANRGLADPEGIHQHAEPVQDSIRKWHQSMAGSPDKIKIASKILERLPDEDLARWQTSREALWSELQEVAQQASLPSPTRKSRHALERKLLVHLRRNIHHNLLGKIVHRIRFLCDVLLRQ